MKVWHLLAIVTLVIVGWIWLHRDSTAFPIDMTAAAATSCGGECGIQHWPVTTLSDQDRHDVDFRPSPSTVFELAGFQRPAQLGHDWRAAPVETTLYEVDAYLVGWSDQSDGDVHLVLADPDYPGVTMVAEIPDPICSGSCSSGAARYFADARPALRSILSAPNPADELIHVRVTGVGFFDHNHGQIGAAPNLVELHPVLAIRRLN